MHCPVLLKPGSFKVFFQLSKFRVQIAMIMFTTTLTHFFVTASRQFTGEGYMEYRTTSGNIINSDKDELRIEFRTVQPSGLLFYARNSGGQFADYVALELVGGRLRYVLLTDYDM